MEAIDVVACALAAYSERCGVAETPSQCAWCAIFLRRAAGAAGVSEECVRRALAKAQHVAALGEESTQEEFVVLCTPERALQEQGKACRGDVAETCGSVARACAREGSYDSRSRAVLKDAVMACGGSWRTVARVEGEYADEAAVIVDPALDQSRGGTIWFRVSLAAVGGGAVLALSGGAAAPSLAASILGGATAMGADGVASCITGVFGALGAGVSGFKARRRFAVDGDWRLVPLRPNAKFSRFYLVPGWKEPSRDPTDAWGGPLLRNSSQATPVDDDDGDWDKLDVEGPVRQRWWEDLALGAGADVVVWEQASLQRLYGTMRDASVWVEARDRAARGLVDEILRRSALGAASIPLALLDQAAAIDDPWAIAIARSKAAGVRLAHELLEQSDRQAVTLLGYSIGARVVMHCLEELARIAEDRDDDLYGIVENAVLLGAPVAARPQRWIKARKIVAGRLVNGYSRRDWMLRLVYRSKAWSLVGVAGAQPIFPHHSPKIENLDLTDLVNGHLTYPHVMQQIFARLNLEPE